MKKLVSILLCAAMLLAFAACKKEPPVEANNSPAPTEAVTENPTEVPTAVPTAAPTEVPTEAPTEIHTPEPTEVPTPEPTAVPEPKELDFDSCAEAAMKLEWGYKEDEVFIHALMVGRDGDDWEIPQHFNIIEGKIYVFDRYSPFGNGILECDPETGEITRLSPDIGENSFTNSEFAVMDGRLIFSDCMYDLATGERIELQPIPSTPARRDGVLMMNILDGKCFAYRAVNYEEGDEEKEFLFTQATYAYYVFELDMENLAWVQKGRIEMPKYVPHAEPPFTPDKVELYERACISMYGGDGGIFDCFDRYMGTDDAGNHYVDSEEVLVFRHGNDIHSVTKWRRIIKFSPEGSPLSFVDVYYPEDYIFREWDNYLVFKVDGDGTVWYMCETEKELTIYKIHL